MAVLSLLLAITCQTASIRNVREALRRCTQIILEFGMKKTIEHTALAAPPTLALIMPTSSLLRRFKNKPFPEESSKQAYEVYTECVLLH
jgi:hypothetical protein